MVVQGENGKDHKPSARKTSTSSTAHAPGSVAWSATSATRRVCMPSPNSGPAFGPAPSAQQEILKWPSILSKPASRPPLRKTARSPSRTRAAGTRTATSVATRYLSSPRTSRSSPWGREVLRHVRGLQHHGHVSGGAEYPCGNDPDASVRACSDCVLRDPWQGGQRGWRQPSGDPRRSGGAGHGARIVGF